MRRARAYQRYVTLEPVRERWHTNSQAVRFLVRPCSRSRSADFPGGPRELGTPYTHLRLIRDNLHPSAYFIDVWSSIRPYDYWTADGKYYSAVYLRNTWGELFAWIRDYVFDVDIKWNGLGWPLPLPNVASALDLEGQVLTRWPVEPKEDVVRLRCTPGVFAYRLGP